MTRYRQEDAIDGRWSRDVQPVMRDVKPYKMCCCDCSLVHDIEFWIVDDEDGGHGHVKMRVARNNRATGQVRRHMAKA